jgi:hypothetical protein
VKLFNFGNKKPSIKQYAIVGIILTSIIAGLSQCTGIPEVNIWDVFDEIQRKYFPGSMINDFIIKDPQKLDSRIIRDVDRAIGNYWKKIGESPVQIPAPIFSEKPIDSSVCYTEECKSLGGEIRVCAPWVLDCVKEDENQTK